MSLKIDTVVLLLEEIAAARAKIETLEGGT